MNPSDPSRQYTVQAIGKLLAGDATGVSSI